jgi:hypothetical protein
MTSKDIELKNELWNNFLKFIEGQLNWKEFEKSLEDLDIKYNILR